MTDMLYGGKALVEMIREQIDTAAPDLHGALIAATAREAARTRAAVTCRTCGRPATRFSSPFSVSGGRLSAECTACNEARAMADQQRVWLARALGQPHDAHVRARATQPTEPAQLERRFCACGQELRRTTAEGQTVVFPAGSQCGDCRSMGRRFMNPKRAGDMSNGRSVVTAKTLDARIAAAQPPKRDADPTQAWGAGATPSYDWEGR